MRLSRHFGAKAQSFSSQKNVQFVLKLCPVNMELLTRKRILYCQHHIFQILIDAFPGNRAILATGFSHGYHFTWPVAVGQADLAEFVHKQCSG
jgi:hypothetical protein